MKKVHEQTQITLETVDTRPLSTFESEETESDRGKIDMHNH